MGLTNNPICRKCGTQKETSVHVLCACEALASLKTLISSSFFLDPEDIRKLNIGAIWKFAKQGSSNLVIEHGAQRACPKA